jgi:hypothetical protein
VAVHAALQEAADTIVRMPAFYITYPNGAPVLPTERQRAPKLVHNDLDLDAPFLFGFGVLRVPIELWRALQRFSAWVEPALITEWARLMRAYANGQQRALDESVLGAAMTWSEPARDVALPRDLALRQLAKAEPVYCVWSGRRLDASSLDIDHCFPWSVWACGDLWNLLPAHRTVNQRQKRDRLPSDDVLRIVREPIQSWWQSAYLAANSAPLSRRFVDEACASLPGLMNAGDVTPSDVFDGMRLQRLRLRANQQVPEWFK